MKKFFLSAALLAASFVPAAYSASIVDLGTISSNLAPQAFAFASGFDFHSVSFEVGSDGDYQFTVADMNTGPGTFAGSNIDFDVMDRLALDIREDTGAGLGPTIASGGYNTAASDMAVFTAALETGKRYVGAFIGFTSTGADIGQASFAVSAVPIPASALLLASAIGGVVIVRRRRETTTA